MRLVTALLVLGALLLPTPVRAAPSPKTILDAFDDLYRGDSATGTMTMEVVTPRYSRTLKLEFWSLGPDHSLVRILSPQKERGTATLRSGNDIWNYLPKVDRTIKVPISMMGGAWMGSDFTNDDLVKESRTAEDYVATLSFTGQREGEDIYELTCTPRPEAAVVWGKILVSVRKADLLPLQARYFKENGALARTLAFTAPRDFPDRARPPRPDGSPGTRRVPTRLTVTPANEPGQHTVVTYDDITFGVSIPARRFQVGGLRD
jgi:outer membrane lipoprotein-sorting protein